MLREPIKGTKVPLKTLLYKGACPLKLNNPPIMGIIRGLAPLNK
jgi:hypothetical protein